MAELTIERMLEMQHQLQERYKSVWAPICPQQGQNQLLYMIGETGEVIDIIKKKGARQIMEDPDIRHDFVEELADVLMYFGDVMLCYGISADELSRVYEKKFQRNMQRWDPRTGEQKH